MRTLHRFVHVLALAGIIVAFTIGLNAQQTAPAGSTLVSQTSTVLDAATAVGHSHATGVTITITVPAGQFAYITGWDASDCATGTAVGAAAPTYITTTGIAGSPQIQIGSGVTAGLCQPTYSVGLAKPLKSQTAGTNVTFVMPTFATNQVVSFNVYYYLGY